MVTHNLMRLLSLGVNTSYYRDESHLAVCEVNSQEENKLHVSLFVDGQSVGEDRSSLEDCLRENNIKVDGWTTRPGRR